MNAKTLGLITLVLAMIVASLAAPMGVAAQTGGDELLENTTYRVFMERGREQAIIAMEVDTGSPFMASSGFDYFDAAMIEDTFDVTVFEELRITRPMLREMGVNRLATWTVHQDYDGAPGMVAVAQDGRYLYIFYLMVIPADGMMDTDPLYDVMIDTSEHLLASIPVPRGYMDITDELDSNDDLPFGGSSL